MSGVNIICWQILKMSGVTIICWQILICEVLLNLFDKF